MTKYLIASILALVACKSSPSSTPANTTPTGGTRSATAASGDPSFDCCCVTSANAAGVLSAKADCAQQQGTCAAAMTDACKMDATSQKVVEERDKAGEPVR
jgi:hypothetical protein